MSRTTADECPFCPITDGRDDLGVLAFRSDIAAAFPSNQSAGGQDVFHLHFHVVPRFADDGFYRGESRWPLGRVKVPIATRREQAAMIARHVDADDGWESP